MRIEDYTNEELDVLKKVINILNINYSDMSDEMDHDYLTINTGRDGKQYAWYYDGFNNIAVEIGNINHTIYENEINNMFGTGTD